MKTFRGASLLPHALIIATLLIASNLALLAQSDTNDLGGLELPLVESPPQIGGTFRLLSSYYLDANGFIRFSRPPTPVIPMAAQGLPVYYLMPDTNFGIFSTNSYVIDHSSATAQGSAMTEESQEETGGGNDEPSRLDVGYAY